MPEALPLPSQAQKLELQMFTLATPVAFFFKSAHLDFSTLYLSSTGLVSVQDNNFLEKTMCTQKDHMSSTHEKIEAMDCSNTLYVPGPSTGWCVRVNPGT